MPELRYPIYRISWVWDQSDYQNNSSGYTIMKKEPVDIEVLTREAVSRWKKYVRTKKRGMDKEISLRDKHPVLTKIEVSFVEIESWCEGWFSHYTFNTEMTDAELIESFHRYIQRKARQNEKNGHYRYESVSGNKNPYHCLMGAEDRWRWKGPCRCVHCVKQGIVKIDH